MREYVAHEWRRNRRLQRSGRFDRVAGDARGRSDGGCPAYPHGGRCRCRRARRGARGEDARRRRDGVLRERARGVTGGGQDPGGGGASRLGQRRHRHCRSGGGRRGRADRRRRRSAWDDRGGRESSLLCGRLGRGARPGPGPRPRGVARRRGSRRRSRLRVEGGAEAGAGREPALAETGCRRGGHEGGSLCRPQCRPDHLRSGVTAGPRLLRRRAADRARS